MAIVVVHREAESGSRHIKVIGPMQHDADVNQARLLPPGGASRVIPFYGELRHDGTNIARTNLMALSPWRCHIDIVAMPRLGNIFPHTARPAKIQRSFT